MAKSLSEWLQEGQQLYDQASDEYRQLEEQAQEVQQKLAAKRTEVNQIATVIGKQPIEEGRGVGPGPGPAVEVIDPGSPNTTPYTRNSIARALTGQPLRR